MQVQPARFRALLWQALVFGLLAGALLYLFRNLALNLESRGAATGFSFLNRVARIPVSNSPIEFEQGVGTYGFALFVGALNSLKITFAAILTASLLGLLVGTSRLSRNLLLSSLAGAYVEIFRNVPVLLHILIWYMIFTSLPGPSDAWSPLPGVFVSNRGLQLPWMNWGTMAWETPQLEGFGFSGGAEVTPEYASLVLGLSFYTAAFIGEIVRSGILSVDKGQWEAAEALGLGRRRTLSKVVLPQALRVTIPPTTSEYLGILKNSSLAVAIGYQELTSVGNTTLYETGQAVEVIGLTMLFYLAVSLAVSALMNWYNGRVALVQR